MEKFNSSVKAEDFGESVITRCELATTLSTDVSVQESHRCPQQTRRLQHQHDTGTALLTSTEVEEAQRQRQRRWQQQPQRP